MGPVAEAVAGEGLGGTVIRKDSQMRRWGKAGLFSEVLGDMEMVCRRLMAVVGLGLK